MDWMLAFTFDTFYKTFGVYINAYIDIPSGNPGNFTLLCITFLEKVLLTVHLNC